jgi:tripartite-type tricarboxylate transporter receptor subunit TctC
MKLNRHVTATVIAFGLAVSASSHAMAEFPEEGKRITLLVGSGAGGGADLFYRLLAGGLEKEIGREIEVVNKEGSGTMFALQALSTAAPDGYTICQGSLPTAIMVSLDPQRQAQFKSSSFTPVAMVTSDPGATAVQAEGPYKSLKDLVDAAKAKPDEIKFGAGSKGTRQHLDALTLEQALGVTFRKVHAGSDSNPVTMLLGGHLDVVQESVGDFLSLEQSGQLRILGVWDTQRSPLAPDTPTMEEQGYKIYSGNSRGIIVPAGTPPEAVDFWDAAIKKVMDTAEFKEGMAKLNQPIRYMGHEEYAKLWQDTEAKVAPLMSSMQ